MAKPKSQRLFKGKGNKANRFKRDVKRFTRMEREGYLGDYAQGVRRNAAKS